MKVLWFTNTPSLANKFLFKKDSTSEGWLEVLEENLKKYYDISLSIAFPYNCKELEIHKFNSTTYYCIPNNSNLFKKQFSKIFHTVSCQKQLDYCALIINDFKPDLINVFGTENCFGLISGLTDIPLVIWIQGILSVYVKKFFSGLTKFETLKYSSLVALLSGNGLFHEYFRWKKRAKIEERIFKNCKHFIGRTDWDRHISLSLSPNRNYYFCDDPIRNIFHNSSSMRGENSNIILISNIRGNLYKGLETIIETSIILKKNFHLEFKWNIIGLKMGDEIVKICRKKFKISFDDLNIYLLGEMNSAEIFKYLTQASLFIHPSHIENSPNSIGEAMLQGLPVIATYAGGTTDIIRHKVDGILVQDGDPLVLAGSIWEVINNKDLFEELSKNAFERAKHKYNTKRIVNDLYSIYLKIVRNQTHI